MNRKNFVPVLVAFSLLCFSLSVNAPNADAAPKAVALNTTYRKKLNTFFSNFAEVNLRPFRRQKVSNQALIDFGVLHRIINNWNLLKPLPEDRNRWRLSASQVDSASEHYFGRKPSRHQNSSHATYKNGYYYGPFANGETFDFAQVTSLADMGKGYYVAHVNIYAPQSPAFEDYHGSPTDWKKQDPTEVPKLVGEIRATIQKVGTGAISRFILLEYLKAG